MTKVFYLSIPISNRVKKKTKKNPKNTLLLLNT